MSLKKGCPSAYSTDILSFGSSLNILLSKSSLPSSIYMLAISRKLLIPSHSSGHSSILQPKLDATLLTSLVPKRQASSIRNLGRCFCSLSFS